MDEERHGIRCRVTTASVGSRGKKENLSGTEMGRRLCNPILALPLSVNTLTAMRDDVTAASAAAGVAARTTLSSCSAVADRDDG